MFRLNVNKWRLQIWFLEYFSRHCDNAEKVDAILDNAEKAIFSL